MNRTEWKPINIDGSMFKRAGAWFGLSVKGSICGDISLQLITCHGIAPKAPDKIRLISICPTYEGRKVPYTVRYIRQS
jgi:hypothetical protein